MATQTNIFVRKHNARESTTGRPSGTDHPIRIGKNSCAMRLCHPETQAKDPACERGVFQSRSPDPSLRCAAFRMTCRVRIEQNPLIVRNEANLQACWLGGWNRVRQTKPMCRRSGREGEARRAKQSQFLALATWNRGGVRNEDNWAGADARDCRLGIRGNGGAGCR